jgi:hypothetical protein
MLLSIQCDALVVIFMRVLSVDHVPTIAQYAASLRVTEKARSFSAVLAEQVLFNILYRHVRGGSHVVVCMASSGVASQLLPSAHSMFAIPIETLSTRPPHREGFWACGIHVTYLLLFCTKPLCNIDWTHFMQSIGNH